MSNQNSGLQPPAVSPNPLSFALAPGSRMTLPEHISNPDGSPLLWRADTAGTDWLSIDKSTGVLQPGQTDLVNVTVDACSLEGGGYESTLTFTSEGDESSASVQVLVTADVSPVLAILHPVHPLEVGLGFGTLFFNSSRTLPLLITNPNDREVQWTVDTGGTTWLSLNRYSGSLEAHEQQTIFVTANSTGLAAGNYAATLTLTNQVAGITTARVPVSVDMHVGVVPFWDSGPHIVVGDPRQKNLNAQLYAPAFKFDTLSNNSNGSLLISNPAENGPVDWSLNTGGLNWLRLDKARGTLQAGEEITVNVTVDKTSLQTGSYSADLLLSFTYDPNTAGREPNVVQMPITFTV